MPTGAQSAQTNNGPITPHKNSGDQTAENPGDYSGGTNRHEPVFFADLNGEIRPILEHGRTESSVHNTFSRFYTRNALYDVMRQWIISDKPFNYD